MSEPVIRLVMASLGDAEGFCGVDGCTIPGPVTATVATPDLVVPATDGDVAGT